MNEGRRFFRFLMPGWLFLLELGLFLLLQFVVFQTLEDPQRSKLWEQARLFFVQVPKGAWTPLSLAIGAAGVPIGYLIFQLYYFCYWSRVNVQGWLLWRVNNEHALDQARTVYPRLPRPVPFDPRGNWDPYTALWYQVLGKRGRDMGIEDRTQRMVDNYHAAGANFVGLHLAFLVWLLLNFLISYPAGWSLFSLRSLIAAVVMVLFLGYVYRDGQHRNLLEYQYFVHSSFLSLLASTPGTRPPPTICPGCQMAYAIRRRMSWWQRPLEVLWGREPT